MDNETVKIEFDIPQDFMERALELGLSLNEIKEMFIFQIEGMIEWYEDELDDKLTEALDDL